MINEIIIDCIEKLNILIADQKYDSNIERHRSSFLYRGLPNDAYHLETSLMRNCKAKSGNVESSILRNFMKYAVKEEPYLEESVWSQLIIGQHHGLPTRLLDWTYM